MDGELPRKEADEIEAHLAGCASCAAALAGMRAAEAGLRSLPAPEPPPFFAAKVAAAAAAVREERFSLARFLRLPAPAAVALSAFILLNVLTFAFNASALESSQRGELAKKAVAGMLRPASMINPVAVARLCGECSAYLCGCMHEAGKGHLCPCKSCGMEKDAGSGDEIKEGHDVR
jgi:anti-sigma factor RsiW